MVNLFVDTSVLIEEIRQGSELWLKIKELAKKEEANLFSSVVVLSELWAGESMNKKENTIIVEKMIEMITFVDVDSVLSKMAGELIRKCKLVGFDSVIAATCIKYGAELVTLNVKHFKCVKGLKLYK